MKTNIKVLLGVLALAVIGAAVYFSKSELQKSATRRPVQRPDYEISSITVDPANPVEGENFKISVVVKNKSSTVAATVPSKTLLHLSGQPLPIATTQPLGPLATEEEVWQTTSAQRRLLIRSCADADRVIAESEERNNCREITLDLLPPPIQEQPPLPRCTDDQYTCDSWTACSAEGSQTGTSCRVRPGTGPGTGCVIPPEPLTRACTPPPPPPPPMPDLVIESASAGQNSVEGSIYVHVTIRNAGTAAANISFNNPLMLSAYLTNSAGSPSGGGFRTLETTVYATGNTAFTFQSGATLFLYSRHFLTPIPDWSQVDVHGVRLTIDSRNNINESNETNNTYDVTIPPEFLAWRPLPDLMVDQFTINTTSPSAGNPVNFSGRIINRTYNGVTGIVAGASTATLTISGTSTYAGLGEVYRQNLAIPELISGTTTDSIGVNFEWPSASEGAYFAKICADSENVVVESYDYEYSNCSIYSGRGFFIVAPAASE